jgi:hypothetical protein
MNQDTFAAASTVCGGGEMVFVLKRIRAKAALWDLSDEEIKDMMATRRKALQSAGMKRVGGHYRSFSGDHVFINSYPNLEALQKVWEELMSPSGLGHEKYFELSEEVLYEVPDSN